MFDIVYNDAKSYFNGNTEVINEYINPKSVKAKLIDIILKPYKDKLTKYRNKRLSIVCTGSYKGKRGTKQIYRIDTYAPKNIPIMSSRNKAKLKKYKLIMEFYKEILKYRELSPVSK